MRFPLRNRWFWAFVVVAAANLAAGGYWLARALGRPVTRVIRVQPEELVDPDGSLFVTFSRTMVARAETGQVQPIPWARTVPAAELLGLWRAPDALEVRARKGFSRATEYELRFTGDLLDSEGHPLEQEKAYKFRTSPLMVLGAEQTSLSRDWVAALRVQFNDEVPLAELDRKIRFVDETGADVPLRRETRLDAARSVAFVSDAKRREWIEVRIEEGLRGLAGPLALPSKAILRVPLEAGMGLKEATGYMNDADDGIVYLRFNLDVDHQVAKDFIRVEPAVPYLVDDWEHGLRLQGGFAAGTLYRVHLRGGLPSEGGMFLPDDVVRSVRMPDLHSRIDFLGEGRFLHRCGEQTVLIRSVNVDSLVVGIERIFTNNIAHFLHWEGDHMGTDLLERKKIPLGAPRNQPVSTRLDLRELLGKEVLGPLKITVRAGGEGWSHSARTVTITDLGIHVKVSPKGVLAWVVRLSDASPVAGAQVTVISRTNQELLAGITDEGGVARLDGTTPKESGEPFLVTARWEDDFSYVPLEDAELSTAGLDVDGQSYPENSYEAFVYPERGAVRPGEEIRLRAILRSAGGEAPPPEMPLAWEIIRPGDRVVATAPAKLSDLGTAEHSWTSKVDLPTGLYRAVLKVPGEGQPELGETTFRVEEFIPETLRVKVQAEERRFAGGSPLEVKVEAEHLFGGAAKGLAARARCNLRPADFAHPGWPGYAFGSSSGEVTSTTLDAEPSELDESGAAVFAFQIPASLRFRSAAQAVVTANVFEVSGRASTARLVREVDPLPFYVGIKKPAGSISIGAEWRAEVAAVRPDGGTADVPQLEGRIVRMHWKHSLKKDPHHGYYRWESERIETEIRSAPVPLSGGRGIASFAPAVGGEYRIRLIARRGAGEVPVEASLDFRVEGGEPEDGSLEKPTRIELTADKPHYRAGETARLHVKSPIAGLALLALETDRVHDARTFQLREKETDIDVPVGADLLPHGYATLTVVRSQDAPGSRGIPVRAYGAAALLRDPAERADKVELGLPAEVRPGKEFTLDLQVSDPSGAPEDCEVAVALVDAGILSLTAFETPDPLEFFLGQRALGTEAADIFSMIVPEPDAFIASAASAPGGDEGSLGLLNPVLARRVKSVSLWVGGLRTDSSGRISKVITAPDFDGELVAMAVAAGRSGVGSAKKEMKVRRPLILELGLPRFLAPGDRFLCSASLHNTTAETLAASVTANLSGHLKLAADEKAEQSAEVKAGGSAVLRFVLEAVSEGKAEVSFACRAAGPGLLEGFESIQSTELPVRPAAPPVTISQTLAAEPGKPAVIEPPDIGFGPTAASEVVLSTAIFPSVEGSLRYLLHYPYGCVEQTTSTLIPWIALKDYLKAMDAPGGGAPAYTDQEIRDRVDAGVARLFSMQTPEGGLGFWPGDHNTYPYGSVYAASIIQEAKAAGYDVPEKRFGYLLDYLESLISRPKESDARRAGILQAKALAVLAREGRPKIGWIDALFERREELSEEALAHLAVAAAHSRHPLPKPLLDPDSFGKPAETRGPRPAAEKVAAPADLPRDLGGILYSRPRELCIVLSALVDLGTPREKILPILTALGGFRKNGRFRSTQEDGLFVFALGKAARLFPPPGPATVVLEEAGQPPRPIEVKGRTVIPLRPESFPVKISLDGAAGIPALALGKIGEEGLAPAAGAPGTPAPSLARGSAVFAFFHCRGTPRGKPLEEDQGIVVRRRFLDRNRQPHPGGMFRQGEPVLVEIQIRSGRHLQNVVVVDALPAGFEIENTNLASADGVVQSGGGLQIGRTDIRDDRLLLFAHTAQGSQSYLYAVRAVTPGNFALPPIAAECMYDSEIRSVHGSGVVEVVR